jgi:hypothetical protein
VGSKSSDRYPYKRKAETERFERHKEDNVTTAAETGVMHSQAKEC